MARRKASRASGPGSSPYARRLLGSASKAGGVWECTWV